MADGGITITVTMKVTIGTLDEIGLGGFRQPWLGAGRDGRHYELTAGAGLGSDLLEASVTAEGRPAQFAKAEIGPVAQQIFRALDAAIDAAGPEEKP